MLQELLLSVASGLIVALLLEYFRGRNRKEQGMTQSMPPMKPFPPIGGQKQPGNGAVLFRVALAILGGLGLAFLALNILQAQTLINFQPGTQELVVMSVAGTFICWLLLAGLMRRS
ncbi:MAG: hypothetical protein SGJ17_02740 [Hyphomicrobiales bacterium]|nr:hypothetical protein [Hyphomicrobiales bacterium]